jgi:hypothetical protein
MAPWLASAARLTPAPTATADSKAAKPNNAAANAVKPHLAMIMNSSAHFLKRFALLAFVAISPAVLFAANDGQRFDSPQQAIDALSAAAKSGDTNQLRQIFGSSAHDLVSPDLVQATEERTVFVQRAAEKIDTTADSDSKKLLLIGNDAWPFPIPLVKTGNAWVFDVDAGKTEVLNRRIGRNEISAIRVCRAYVDAQREYASQDRNGNGILEFAQRLRSSPNAHDGLFWPARGEDDEQSPFGPLIARARFEGYRRENKILTDDSAPFHGYYFKILTRQGKHAAGGKYNYIINGHMIAGFGLVAWPAEWGNSGIMTFIVNQQGKVFQKDLGPKTAAAAQSLKSLDPDDNWTEAKE